MRKTFGGFGLVAILGITLALAGCAAEEGNDDPGPGNGPVADEPAPPTSSQTGSSSGSEGSSGTSPPAGSSTSSGSPAPADQKILAQGTFVNKSYSGSGTALLVAGADNSTFLRLENIAVSSGPALNVLLTKHASPSSKADVEQGSLDLGALRATKGNLTYTIPANTDLTAYSGVIVYCVEYSVVFTAATLER